MLVTREELIKTRKQLLKDMDTYVRDYIGDYEITCDIWFAIGVPDWADDSDYTDIAEDDELWTDCVNAFARCCKWGE